MSTLFCRQPAHQPGLIRLALGITLALVFIMGLWQPIPASAIDRDAATAAQKAPYEQQMKQIEVERLTFQRDLAKREEECLKRFFSASCLDQIRAEHLREMRGFDLRQEAALQAVRDIDAKARANERATRIRERDDKQDAARKKAAAGAPRS